jgi:quercetin dioxygenase-like cupin family protein
LGEGREAEEEHQFFGCFPSLFPRPPAMDTSGLTQDKIIAGALVDLVAYQKDAIVSKVLTKSKAGNVTLFAFAAGQELSEHSAPFEALIQILDGAAEIGVGGNRFHADTGCLVRLPANIPHWVRADEPMKIMLIMLRHPPDQGSVETQ